MLIGEIENYIRCLIDNKFTCEELQALRDPSDDERAVQSVTDLTLGEYIRLFEDPNLWAKVGLPFDRVTFVKHLHTVRNIRNRVMHFKPDDHHKNDHRENDDRENDLEILRSLGRFLRNFSKIRKQNENHR